MDLLASPWFWGLGGAFIYAGPRLVACLVDGRSAAAFCLGCCWLDWGVSMAVGPIAAAAFTDSIQPHALGLTAPAVAALLGTLANPCAPGAILVLRDGALGCLKALTEKWKS